MDAVGNLTFEEKRAPDKHGKPHSSTRECNIRKFAKDQPPGGRTTKAEVTQRFSPADMDLSLR
jgi:hypothetical protein